MAPARPTRRTPGGSWKNCGHPKVGLCWNSNPGDVVKGSVAESFKLLQPWLRSCHINELWRDQTGAYPYPVRFRLMRENGYDRVTLCEVGKTPPERGDRRGDSAVLQGLVDGVDAVGADAKVRR